MKDSEFDDLIRAAGQNVPVPHSFRQGVWHRIETAAAPSARMEWFTFFTRPWMAGLSVAAALAIGVMAGAASSRQHEDPRIAYIESVSPFAHSSSR